MRELSNYQRSFDWEMPAPLSENSWICVPVLIAYSPREIAEWYAKLTGLDGEEIVFVRDVSTGEITRWRVESETVFTAYRDNSRPIGGTSR